MIRAAAIWNVLYENGSCGFYFIRGLVQTIFGKISVIVTLGGGLIVSYPDPYVRNDDHRLQYDITYREVVRNGSWNVVGMYIVTY